jgi:hypothetical protein
MEAGVPAWIEGRSPMPATFLRDDPEKTAGAVRTAEVNQIEGLAKNVEPI